MITLFFIFLIGLIPFTFALYGLFGERGKSWTSCGISYWSKRMMRVVWGCVGVGVVALIFSLCVLITSSSGIGAQNRARNIYSKIEIVQNQRNQLIDYVERSLSPEELEVVTEAITPDDPGIVVVFANNSSEVLIQKTSKIVELNKELFDLRNKALDYELEICSNRNNYFVPLIPIFYPDCHVDFKTNLPGEVDVYGQ